MRELGRLTNAETLFVERRRNKETQHQAAARFCVSRNVYSLWERDLQKPKHRATLGKLHNYEVCVLYRRRSKMTQSQVAAELGCSKEWVKQMEQGKVNCQDLIEYWEC